MNKYQEYYEALNYEKRPLSTKQDVYTKGSSEYTSLRYLKKKMNVLMPRSFGDIMKHNISIGIVPEINCIWLGLKKFTLWNYVNNSIDEIEFVSPVTHLIIFEPKPNVFNDKIRRCALVINKEQIIIYGIKHESHEFINTDLVVSIPDRILSVAECKGNIFVGCVNGNVYKVVYQNTNMFVMRSIYLRCLDHSFFSFLLPAFFKNNRSSMIVKIVCGEYWMIVLTEKDIRLYSINGEVEIKEGFIQTSTKYVSAEIVEESKYDVFFYCVRRCGSRDFYNKCFIFKRKAPFIDSDLNEVKIVSNKDHLVLYKDLYNRNMVTFICFNKDQFVNFSTNKPPENFEVINIEDVKHIFLHKSEIFVVGSDELKIFHIMSLEEFLLSCRPEETYTFLKNYGDRETIALYYSIMASNRDYTKIEHLYIKNESTHIPAFYSFVYRRISKIWNRKVDDEFLAESEKVIVEIMTVVNKLKLKEKFIFGLIETINFLRIYYDYGLRVESKLSKIFLENLIVSKSLLNNLLDQFTGKIDTIINLLVSKCPSFIPLNEIYYQKGLECLEKNDLYEALNNFKNINNGLEPIVKKFNELNFYVGSATLIGKIDVSYEKRVDYLKQSVQCRGSLDVVLCDFRQEIAFCLFEAILKNLQANEYMQKPCRCCGDNNKGFLKNDFLGLSSSFLEQFLIQKLELSLKEVEYSLLWKYYVLNGFKDKAVASIIKIVENKPIKLEKIIEYLNIALSIMSSVDLKIKIGTAKIQKELLQKKYIPILENVLLSPNDLLNDYVLPNKCYSLGLKLVDMFDYCDSAILRKIWSDALSNNDLRENLKFIKELNLKKSPLNFEIIGSILICKLEQDSPNLIDFFVEYGFPKSEVIDFFGKMLNDSKNIHPAQKKKILDLLLCSNEGNEEDVKRIARYCQQNYGIR